MESHGVILIRMARNGGRFLADFVQDVRFGLRGFRQNPGFTALAIVSLALGIGASTAVFSIVQAVLIRPLPYDDPGRIVLVWDQVVHARNMQQIFDTFADLKAYRRDSRTLEDAAGFTWARGPKTLTGHGPARNVLYIPVSDNFFRVLGVSAATGRTFRPEDITQGCSLVLAHRFWETDLGANPRIIGSALTLDDRPCTVLGVMPQSFSFYPAATSMWMLITPDMLPAPPDQLIVGIAGRLRTGVTLAAAEKELTAIHARLHEADKQERNIVPRLYAIQDEFTYLAGRNLRTTLLVLFAAVAMLMVLACVNVANLILGRAATREREFAIRTALGSGRARLILQMLTEALLLGTVAAVIGLLLAEAAVRWLRAANPIELPPGAEVRVNGPILLFGVVTAVLSVVAAGFVPALRVSRADVNSALKAAGRAAAGSRGGSIWARAFIIAELTLSLMLLAGAGLLMNSILRMDSSAAGFENDRVLTMSVGTAAGARPDAVSRAQFFDAVLRRVSLGRSVRMAAFTTSLPSMGTGNDVAEVEGRPVRPDNAAGDTETVTISPEYFRVLNVPLLHGRAFNVMDRGGAPAVAVVNAALAAKYFPREHPIGRRIRIFDERRQQSWRTIVGVVGNEKRTSVFEEMNWIEGPILYVPLAQAEAPASLTLALVTAVDPSETAKFVRREVGAVDPSAPVDDVMTMRDLIYRYLAYPRFRAAVVSLFAAIAIAMALVGLYGVLAQGVAQRSREIGILIALGATPRRVLALVVRQSMLLVVPGIIAGVLLARALTRFIGSLLYGIQPTDTLTFALVVCSMLVCGLAATIVPAARALALDPAETLRAE